MLDDTTLTRLTKLLGMLGSDQVGERAAAAAKAHELLRAHGLDEAELIDLVRRGLAVVHARPTPPPQPEPRSSRPAADAFQWNPSPERDGRPGFWARMGDGTILGVRQCRAAPGYPPAWTANVAGQLIMTTDGKPVFYPSAEEAKMGAMVESLMV